MTLHSNCHLVLGHNVNGPTEYTVDPFLQDSNHLETTLNQSGVHERRRRESTPHVYRSCDILPSTSLKCNSVIAEEIEIY